MRAIICTIQIARTVKQVSEMVFKICEATFIVMSKICGTVVAWDAKSSDCVLERSEYAEVRAPCLYLGSRHFFSEKQETT